MKYLHQDGRVMHHRQVYEALGIPQGHHIPNMLIGLRKTVAGVSLTVLGPDHSGGTFKHRIMAECPHCGKVVGFGRLQQHLKVHS